ncbi:MAG: squalene/phytoene synthase family protein [Boseongicola sp.]|nr:squalene/phytoene synthase family protein [Boseongicola sp.]
MSLQACAEIVQRGDPDRFAAAMAAPVDARRVLFPLYAFNIEVARAPWVTEEPMIAEMRLQWWRDALEEIAERRHVRRHEVTTPLAEVLPVSSAEILDQLIAARRWDIYKEAFEDSDHFAEYLKKTGGSLMWAAADALGAHHTARETVEAFGQSTALSRFLRAAPALENAGRIPLVDGTLEGISNEVRRALEGLPSRSTLKTMLPELAFAAVLEGWQTDPLLNQIAQNPTRVADGTIGLSEFRRRSRLIRWAL